MRYGFTAGDPRTYTPPNTLKTKVVI